MEFIILTHGTWKIAIESFLLIFVAFSKVSVHIKCSMEKRLSGLTLN